MHQLETGEKTFDPSFEIAESWRRLSEKNPDEIQPHDLILLKHELLEMQYVISGLTQNDAHIKASEKYNYALEAKRFYEKIESDPKHRTPKPDKEFKHNTSKLEAACAEINIEDDDQQKGI